MYKGTAVLDIETYRNIPDWMDPEKEIDIDRRLKDPDKIAEAKTKKLAEFNDRACLSPITGRIVCIGVKPTDQAETRIISGPDETKVLSDFCAYMAELMPYTIITFNGRTFDVPYLTARIAANWLVPEWKLPFPKDYNRHIDLFEVLGRHGNLDNWARALTGSVMEGSGADVGRWVEANDWNAINVHCLADVYATDRLYSRIINVIGKEK